MSKKRSTMFDDDEDLAFPAQDPSTDPAEKNKTAEPGLFNDEAAALIDAKAKQAAEQSVRVAKAGLAAAGRAAAAMKAKGEQLKAQVQAKREGSKRPLVIGLTVIVLVVGGATGWWVWSKDQDHAEPHHPVAPVVLPPAPIEEAAPQPAVEAPAPPAEVMASPTDAPAQEVFPDMPMIPPAGGAYVSPSHPAVAAPVQEPAPAPAEQPPAPVAQTPVSKPAPVEQRSPAVARPKPARVASKPQPSAPTPRPAEPAPVPIGEREQQQIEQFRALLGDKP